MKKLILALSFLVLGFTIEAQTPIRATNDGTQELQIIVVTTGNDIDFLSIQEKSTGTACNERFELVILFSDGTKMKKKSLAFTCEGAMFTVNDKMNEKLKNTTIEKIYYINGTGAAKTVFDLKNDRAIIEFMAEGEII